MDDWHGEYTGTRRILRLILVYSPSQFFAVTQLKGLVSHILLNFDVKMDKAPLSDA